MQDRLNKVEAGSRGAGHPVVPFLRRQPGTLYALFDAARDSRVLRLLRASSEPYRSLYEGPQGEELADYAPYLVELPRSSNLLEPLVQQGWGQSWGMFLTSRSSFPEVRKHFRRFLLVQFEDGREAYFRFYDPRVLRRYLPTCTPEEIAKFFGPIEAFVLEDEKPAAVQKLTAEWRGLKKEVVSLGRASVAAN
jgi:hypothetical protein